MAIWATNYPEWLYLLFGCAKIGAILVTVNTNYKQFELEYLLRQSDSMSLFFIDGQKDTDYVKIVREMLPGVGENGGTLGRSFEKLPYLKNIVYIPYDKNSEIPNRLSCWDDMMALGKNVTDEELDAVSSSSPFADEVITCSTLGDDRLRRA